MATLQQLGVTLGVGCGILTTTLLLFGGAVRLRITHIAPRCEARPREVIYNSDSNCHESQNRGNPFLLGWVFWVLRLNYHTLLEGVPGTGTREGGLSGHLLKTNLDMVVLLRFHALALKIAVFAMFVYCGIALPVYFTARCFHASRDNSGNETYYGSILNCTYAEHYELTHYERITLTNIPALAQVEGWDTENDLVSFRLYMVVLCTYIVCWYTCYELQQEWIDLLAMRRVYYLEYDHWKGRREEQQATRQTQKRNETPHNNKKQKFKDSDNPYIDQRESWIPHPELSDTPPNIGLYSVLVGGLPSRPRQAVLDEDVEAALAAAEQDDDDSQKLDWQLSVTAAFFDYCVPNQPGFSSSVAAVSILPSASELAVAWKKFYRATKRLSRLRFIRRQLLERGYNQDDLDDDHKELYNHLYGGSSDDDSYEAFVEDEEAALSEKGDRVQRTLMDDGSSRRRRAYTTEILGSITDEDVETLFLQSLQMGPEQTAVYSREMARSVANCCPHGCCEEEVYCASVDKLLIMEAQAKESAQKAFDELEKARRSAALAQEMRAERHNGHQRMNLWLNESSTELATPSPAKKKDSKTVESRIYKKGHSTLASSTKQRASGKQGRSVLSEFSRIGSSHSLNTTPESMSPPSSRRSINTQPELKRQDSDDSFKSATSNLGPSESSKHAHFDNVNGSDHGVHPVPPLPRPRALHGEWEGILKPSSWGSSMVLNPDPVSTNEKDVSASSNAQNTNTALDPWEIVELVANEAESSASRTGTLKRDHRVDDGAWHWPTYGLLRKRFKKKVRSFFSWFISTTEDVTDVQARDSTFAVVTFTSRQAAIAARDCLSDGRGAGRWHTMEEVPTPPLADASAFNICDCRGCMRPVTVTLNEKQKVTRNYVALGMVGLIYIFYTYPITYAASFGTDSAEEYFGTVNPTFTSEKLFGFIRAQLLNLFLAACPDVFLAIANFGSNATSMVGAEFAALQYYWWFMVLFALLSSSFFQMLMRSADKNGSLEFLANFQKVAKTIPSEVSATWANWIILKFTIFHPLFYLLQLNSFLFSCLGLRCCARLGKGGGSGNRIPYRIYVESGVVLMCVLALAPAAPIVSIVAVMYFFVCTPLLRYAVIFTYKPQWDAGGIRFPFLAEMVISSLLAGQVLLTTIMALKKAPGPASLACILSVPTIVFRQTCRKRFLRAFNDAALMQTALLDGWDAPENSSNMEDREAFRRFLVDSHKAAYVPACIAGTNTDRIITAEPAVVIPSPTDADFGMAPFAPNDDALPASTDSTVPPTSATTAATPGEIPSAVRNEGVENQPSLLMQPSLVKNQQAGAVMRRGTIVFNPAVVACQQQIKSVGSVATTERTASSSSGRNISAYVSSFRLAGQGTKTKKEY